MRSFQGKSKIRTFAESKPFLVFLGIVVVVFAWNVFGFVGKMLETEKNRKIAENKVIDLRKEKDILSADLARLQTDQGKEEAIRSKFGMVKDGEEVIVIVDDKNRAVAPKEADDAGFFGFFKNLFK